MKRRGRSKPRYSNLGVKEENKDWRIRLVGLFVIVFGVGLCSRLFFLQIKDFRYFSALARGQQQSFEVLAPPRGNIYATSKNGETVPLAMNKKLSTVFAIPKNITDDENFSKTVSLILGKEQAEIADKIKDKTSSYKVLAQKVEQEKVDDLKKVKLKGIDYTTELSRFYPYGKFASQTIGFVGFHDQNVSTKSNGQYGLEKYFNDILAGKEGYSQGQKDAKGQSIFSKKGNQEEPENGADLYLTLDYNVQFQAEKIISEYCEKLKAEKGVAIVEEVSTGKIKALANWQNFDPNAYWEEKTLNIFQNDAVERVYEPGSIFKPITFAIALDLQKITPEETYTDPGTIFFGTQTIKNFDEKSNGVQTMTQVLEKSLNTGAVYIQQKIGKEKFKEYLEKFDFGKKTEVDLPGELNGYIGNLNSNRDINYATASFGQGISVTPMQFVKAASAIANRGIMMKPYIVEKKVYDGGKEEFTNPEVEKQIISPEASSFLSAMMVSVVKNGHAKRAQIPGYFIAGKTGTAQVPNVGSGGYSNQTIHSFFGFFPAFDPKYLVFIKIDKPQGVEFAESSAVPAFKDLSQYLINYYEIPPDYIDESKPTVTPATMPAPTPKPTSN